jgi:hypothetical protein
MKSCVLIVPLAYHAAANQLAELMGWGPNSYSVPLSADGSEPATHYGLHAWVTPEFEAMIAGTGQGEMPEALVQAGYPLATTAWTATGKRCWTRTGWRWCRPMISGQRQKGQK